ETGLRLRAVAVPVGAPDAVQIPAEAAQYLLPQAVPVPCGLGRVVHGAVALDAQREPAGERGMADRHVDPVAAHADLRLDVVAPACEDVQNGLLERALGRGVVGERRVFQDGVTAFGVVQ